MTLHRRFLTAALLATFAAPLAFAAGVDLGSHDSNAPVGVSADDFSGDLSTRAGTYKGNVIVTQGNFKLRADQVDVHTVNGVINDIVSNGHVLFDAPSGQAKGDKAVYLLGPRTVTMTGDVILTRNKNVMRGTQLVVNLQTGKADLTAHGTKSGRVESMFTPPPKQTKAPAAPAEPEKPK